MLRLFAAHPLRAAGYTPDVPEFVAADVHAGIVPNELPANVAGQYFFQLERFNGFLVRLHDLALLPFNVR